MAGLGGKWHLTYIYHAEQNATTKWCCKHKRNIVWPEKKLLYSGTNIWPWKEATLTNTFYELPANLLILNSNYLVLLNSKPFIHP